ncbi:hypothetical protein [Pseudomonas sp. Irchel 3F5]|uniref:RCC1 domain-containing protein n=1 Tax=Pseudomonas sp. Irchel 3F5 TaxID=2009002 RepID=UPI000BA31727|nr:hypothetical protein [Pseudomonas sp. Irchel 3F5]
MTRAEAPFALRAQRQSLSPRNLARLRIPLGDLIDVLVEDDNGEWVPGDAGVNLALSDDPRGLVVGIALWAGAQAFEEIDVDWGGSLAVSHFLSPAELDAPEGILYLRVPLRRLQDGQAEVSYTVWHLDGNSSESAAIRVLVKRTRPGGRDNDAEEPGHQGLVPAGLADELIDNGIGPIEAAAGVEVSIAAYEHMRVRDRIELDWGGEPLVHVLAAQEVGRDLTLKVDEALILAAGDGEIKMAWKVTDEVLNRSRDADERPWSASTTVEVYASDAQLYPPYVKIRDEYVDEVIDLNELDLDDVTVEVFTDPHHFAEGNWVELFWNGFTVEGERVQHRQQRQVERVPGAVTFMVPNGQAQVLGGGGRVVLYYQVKAGETTPPLHSSQRTTRRIEGEGAGVGLRAPTVLEAQGGHLDPTLAEATIRVAAYPGINIGDVLTVVFSGTRADGGEVYFDNTRNVTSGQIERGEILRGLPGEYIAALDGRRAEVYYLVNGRRSETLGLVIGELQATLQAPTVQEVAEGVLDPAAVGPQGASLKIPLYEGIALGDRVTYLWRGSEADGSTSDQSEITSLSEPLVFDVPKAFVEANLNGSVEVSYSIARNNQPGQGSLPLRFEVRTGRTSFEVLGARSQRGAYYYANPNRLVALGGAGTVHWQYAGDAESEEGRSFIDTAPERVLNVTYRSDRDHHLELRALRPAAASGVLRLGQHDSGCLVKNDGSLFGWSTGGSQLLPPAGINNVVHVCGGGHAYVALTRNGQVRAWGVSEYGGHIPVDVAANLVGVRLLAPSGRAFAAVLGSGRVEAWGDESAGGVIPPFIKANLRNVVQIVGSDAAFAARRDDGRVFCWGQGVLEGELVEAFPCNWLCASNGAFAALRSDGSVQGWGAPEQGGDAPVGLAGIRQLASTSRAFAALDLDGHIHCWGDPRFGGGQPPLLTSPPVQLVGASSAFAVLLEDATVRAWGEMAEGANVPAGLRNVVSLTSRYGGFTALRQDRSWLAWGRTSGATASTDTHCIYHAGSTLLALHETGEVSGWGESAPDFSSIRGEVSYYQATVDEAVNLNIHGQ